MSRSPTSRPSGGRSIVVQVSSRLRVFLAVSAALATLYTWLVFDCIPIETSMDGVPLYSECDPPTALGRLLINLVLVGATSGATFLAAIVFRAVRRRSGGIHPAALP